MIALVAVSAVGALAALPHQQQAGGLVTTFDSTRDTIVARVSGAVPAAALKRLVTEMRIAPGADDTSSFTETYEFDVDRRGFIWVFDRPTNSIFLFDSAGKLVRRIGGLGAGPGEFRGNGGMVVLRDGRLAQWDPQNSRISFFSPAGELLTSWPLQGGFGSSDNLITDTSGRLYTIRVMFPSQSRGRSWAGAAPDALVRYREGGAFGDTLHPPRFDIPNYTYSAQSATSASAMGVVHTPNSLWAWAPGGYFVAGDGSKYHITIGRPNAKPIRIERSAPAVPIADDERQGIEAYVIAGLRRVDPSWSWRGPPLPRTKAPLMSLYIARDGRIWAQVPTPSERVPDSEITKPQGDSRRPPPPAAPVFRSPPAWEVFSSDGVFLGRVPLPMRAQLVHAEGNRVWLLDRDDDDLPAIVRARIEPALPNR